jgi:hypothetical protein
MIQKVSLPVSVIASYNHKTRSLTPRKVLFEGREHLIVHVGYHHTFRDGRSLYHVFSVASETLFFKLVFNTETLGWMLEEISDGESN